MIIWFRDEDSDPLDSARGLVIGTLCGMGFWFAVGMGIYWIL